LSQKDDNMPAGDSLPKGEGEKAAEEKPHAITIAVTDMLQRHGVSKGDFASTIATALDMTVQSAYRKLSDNSAWSHDDLQKLAKGYGEDPLALVASDFQHGAPLQGRVEINDLSLPCTFWPDVSPDRKRSQLIGPMVALAPLGAEGGEPWTIVPIDQRGDRQATAIRALYINFSSHRQRVAVIDDDSSVSEGLAALLRLKGWDAASFASAKDFERSHRSAPFDAFIVDWLLGSGDARELITQIRSGNRRAPLIVLTGRIATKDVRERDVDAAVHAVGGELMEKPAKILKLMRYLQRGQSSTTSA
jgi:CheY-like chemotaxis protein